MTQIGRGEVAHRKQTVAVKLHWTTWLALIMDYVILYKVQYPYQLPGFALWQYHLISAVSIALFGMSLWIHELSHIMVARLIKLPITRVTIYIIGSNIEFAYRQRRHLHELWVYLIGPLASIVIGTVLFALWLKFGSVIGIIPSVLLFNTAQGNILIGAFNCMPGHPSDGGALLRSVIWGWTEDRRLADRIPITIGIITAGILIGLGNGLGLTIWIINGLSMMAATIREVGNLPDPAQS
ncbi:hypothetical protein HGA91_04175 [candidate division WWE3 bacterium]|nr:hypothetical protein [candidate division WWE3 bacterium]